MVVSERELLGCRGRATAACLGNGGGKKGFRNVGSGWGINTSIQFNIELKLKKHRVSHNVRIKRFNVMGDTLCSPKGNGE
jgi:hypothetical protein